MRPVTFVICAAGKGERFRQKGINISKPKIKLKGHTMLERSIQSLELRPNDQLIIIGQEEDHLPDYFSSFSRVQWVTLTGPTKGQLDTFLKADKLLLHSDVVIYNCDTYFSCEKLRPMIDSGLVEGIIPCSIQPGTSWSFCEVNQHFDILDVAEKRRISDWASVGYYYFRDKTRLLDLARAEVQGVSGTESYVAPLYKRYIEQGLPLKMVPTDTFLPFGTIEQVQDYWNMSLEELINENK